MRNRRQHQIDLAIAEALRRADPYMLRQSTLFADAAREITPRATESELNESLRYHDNAHRLTSVAGETDMEYKLNALGSAWLSENA